MEILRKIYFKLLTPCSIKKRYMKYFKKSDPAIFFPEKYDRIDISVR